MNYLWSAKNNAFFPNSSRSDYEDHGWDLSDAVEVEDSIYDEFKNTLPGKVREVGTDGMPGWVDIPPLSHDELLLAAEDKRAELLSDADEEVKDWRVELELGEISDEDKTRLSAWMSYKKALKAIDISTAPDIAWPEKPLPS